MSLFQLLNDFDSLKLNLADRERIVFILFTKCDGDITRFLNSTSFYHEKWSCVQTDMCLRFWMGLAKFGWFDKGHYHAIFFNKDKKTRDRFFSVINKFWFTWFARAVIWPKIFVSFQNATNKIERKEQYRHLKMPNDLLNCLLV